MSNNYLTVRSLWANYWESKPELIFKIKLKYPFDSSLKKIVSENQIKTAIELGGFPGYYSIYLKKFYNISPTLLDYFVHRELLEKLLECNSLSNDDVEVIETDLFAYTSSDKYDLVLSVGLIEHFDDTKDIIRKHISFLNDEGKLFITVPNFRGVNGWVQRNFDKDNYAKHNISCMDPKFLTQCAQDLGMREVQAYYNGRFSTWLENKETKTRLTKIFVRAIWVMGKVITRIVPIESRIFSPYIVLEAKR